MMAAAALMTSETLGHAFRIGTNDSRLRDRARAKKTKMEEHPGSLKKTIGGSGGEEDPAEEEANSDWRIYRAFKTAAAHRERIGSASRDDE
jgi:hypothetical protein